MECSKKNYVKKKANAHRKKRTGLRRHEQARKVRRAKDESSGGLAKAESGGGVKNLGQYGAGHTSHEKGNSGAERSREAARSNKAKGVVRSCKIHAKEELQGLDFVAQWIRRRSTK